MSRTTTHITDFSKGMAADLRSSQGFARVQHFKVYPHKLVPQFSTEANESKGLGIVRFAYAPWLTGYNLFGLGVNAGGHPAIYMKDTAGGDVVNNGWSTPADGDSAGSGSLTSNNILFPYKNYLYFFSSGTALNRYLAVGSPALTLTYQSISYSNVAPPVHHPADDCAYFFADNLVYRLNNGTWEGVVLTLPDNLIITSAEADGDYLQIACKSKSGLGSSITFKWDRDSSLSTVTAKVDWGRGDLIHIGNLQGAIIGVMNVHLSSAFGHSYGKLVVKAIVGDQAKTIAEYVCPGLSYFDGNKFVSDDKLHFAFEMARDSGYIHGIFSVDALGQLRVEVSEAETDAISAGSRYQGIYKTGEYWWIAHSNDGSVNRTNNQTTYAYTSILETNIIGTPDAQIQLVGASVGFEPLPSGGSVSLYYRKVGDTSWTLIKTVSTAGANVLSATKDSNGKALSFYEVQYRVESTGGAVITSLEYTHDSNDQKPYGRG